MTSVSRIFTGYDNNVQVIYNVLTSSIIRRTSIPVSFTPLQLHALGAFFKRGRDPLGSTEFSISRFLVPYLSNYEGFSIFMDNDIIVTRDIKGLVDLYDPQYAIQVVKHDYTPQEGRKFLGEKQFVYEKKNWSSVIIFNNAKCKALTPSVVETATGKFLHQFKWLESDDLIGELPLEWNFLVDEYEKPDELPALLHYTLGGPYFRATRHCDYADEWIEEFDYMNSTMEGSVNFSDEQSELTT